MQKTYNCPRCGYSTNIFGSYKSHISRKYKCKPRLANISISLIKETLATFIKDRTKKTILAHEEHPSDSRGESLEIENIPITTHIEHGEDSNAHKSASGYIYLLREREFIKTGEHVYKVGKTTQDLFKRFSQYPKKSELLMGIRVQDCHKSELELLRLMRTEFISRKDVGSEYFEGDANDMKKVFLQVI